VCVWKGAREGGREGGRDKLGISCHGFYAFDRVDYSNNKPCHSE